MRSFSRGRWAAAAVPVVTALVAAAAIGTATASGTSVATIALAAAEPVPAGGNCPQTAAKAFNWGNPTRHSDFDGNTVPPDWHPYGPEPGHEKRGTRTPAAVTVAGGIMSINGSQDGTTGAVSWHPGQRYGRWEACVQSDKGSGGLHSLLLLWPVAENSPIGGEIDWMEIGDDSRQKTEFFLHYANGDGEGGAQESGSVEHDATQWTAWALEWTPEKITTYVNGKQWYSSTETSHFPPGPMNMTMQLDYFGGAGGPSAEHMDWASQWALPESEPATLSLAPGAAATGQPKDYPDRKPHRLDGTAAPAGTGTGSGDGSAGTGGNTDGGAVPAAPAGSAATGGRPRLLHPGTPSGTATPSGATAPSGAAGPSGAAVPSGAAGTAPGTRPRTLHPSG